MEQTIHKTKRWIYLLLAVLTVVYAALSYAFFLNALRARTLPQVARARTQVARLLPQLEENEQAVREVYDNLENSRRLVARNHEGALEKQGENGVDADTIIDHTLSWMNRVTMLRVGRRGHVIVISQDDASILAHPDQQFVGEILRPVGFTHMDGTPDISEEENGNRFCAYFPSSFFKESITPARFLAAADAGVYGTAFAYKDTYILCGVTFFEAILFVFVRTFFTTLIFFVIAWVFVRYIVFSLLWGKEEPRKFRSKLTVYTVLSVVLLFFATWYYQTMMDVTGDIATMNEHAQVAVENFNTYQQHREELSAWLDHQYLEQCRIAADLVKGKGKENLTRADLDGYAQELGVKYIYVYDKNGRTMVTNSPYDHFRISENKEDQSYAFRTLLDGTEYVIQEPQPDETSGEKMQYIGVSLRDENDLADGFVQIAIDPALRERLLAPITVQTVLDNLVIGLPEYALAVDKETKEIVATTGLGFEKESVEELGIDVEKLQKDYNGYFDIRGTTYYAGISESDNLYLIPLARSTDGQGALLISLLQTAFALMAFFLLNRVGRNAFQRVFDAREEEERNASETDEPMQEGTAEDEEDDRGFLRSLKDMMGVQDKYGFENRWKEYREIPEEQKTPELRTRNLIYHILLVFSIALILFELFVFRMGMQVDSLDGFTYVFFGNWQKGFNLFSISYCLFLLCVLYVLQGLLNKIMYGIARISNLKMETILLLLKNTLKYVCAVVFLFLGLAKFGVDTRALWASVGILSLIVGIGAKDLISDVIAGLFIIFEGTLQIGDFVMVGGEIGTVEEIGLRYTKVVYYAQTKIFNNSSIRSVVNYNGEVAREILRIPVSYDTDLQEIEKLLERELPEMAKRVPGLVKLPKYQGVNSFEERCVMLRIAIFCDPYRCRNALRSMQREIKVLFDREHIHMPYTHVVVKEHKEDEEAYVFDPGEEETADDADEKKNNAGSGT